MINCQTIIIRYLRFATNSNLPSRLLGNPRLLITEITYPENRQDQILLQMVQHQAWSTFLILTKLSILRLFQDKSNILISFLFKIVLTFIHPCLLNAF